MRSHEEQRQQKISQESLRQRETVKPLGYAGAPSSSSAQVDLSSRKVQNDLLERMLEGENLRLRVFGNRLIEHASKKTTTDQVD
jgi:RNA-directed DNA polymerase